MKKKKLLFTIFVFVFLLPAFIVLSFKMWTINYAKHREIKANLVSHPDLLPTKEMAKITSFWFSNARADLYWLEAIQYIGSNAISAEYKKYYIHLLI